MIAYTVTHVYYPCSMGYLGSITTRHLDIVHKGGIICQFNILPSHCVDLLMLFWWRWHQCQFISMQGISAWWYSDVLLFGALICSRRRCNKLWKLDYFCSYDTKAMGIVLRVSIMLAFPWVPAIHATAYNIHCRYTDVAIMILDIIWTTPFERGTIFF